MSNGLKSTTLKPENNSRDIGKEAMDLIEIIKPGTSQRYQSPIKRQVYDTPKHTRTRSTAKYNSLNRSRNYNEPVDYPANYDRFEKGRIHSNKPPPDGSIPKQNTIVRIEISSPRTLADRNGSISSNKGPISRGTSVNRVPTLDLRSDKKHPPQ